MFGGALPAQECPLQNLDKGRLRAGQHGMPVHLFTLQPPRNLPCRHLQA